MKFRVFSFLFLSILVVSSCNLDDIDADLALIESIQNAEKQNVDINSLPGDVSNALSDNYSESYLEKVLMAADLGYELEMIRMEGTYIGERSFAYFTIEGRELRKHRDNEIRDGDARDRRECFRLVYPITLNMPDGTQITGNSSEELGLEVRTWYAANPDTQNRPSFEFPLDIEFRDGSTVTIENENGLRRAYNNCD